jgi:hypothetical protein
MKNIPTLYHYIHSFLSSKTQISRSVSQVRIRSIKFSSISQDTLSPSSARATTGVSPVNTPPLKEEPPKKKRFSFFFYVFTGSAMFVLIGVPLIVLHDMPKDSETREFVRELSPELYSWIQQTVYPKFPVYPQIITENVNILIEFEDGKVLPISKPGLTSIDSILSQIKEEFPSKKVMNISVPFNLYFDPIEEEPLSPLETYTVPVFDDIRYFDPINGLCAQPRSSYLSPLESKSSLSEFIGLLHKQKESFENSLKVLVSDSHKKPLLIAAVKEKIDNLNDQLSRLTNFLSSWDKLPVYNAPMLSLKEKDSVPLFDTFKTLLKSSQTSSSVDGADNHDERRKIMAQHLVEPFYGGSFGNPIYHPDRIKLVISVEDEPAIKERIEKIHLLRKLRKDEETMMSLVDEALEIGVQFPKVDPWVQVRQQLGFDEEKPAPPATLPSEPPATSKS